MLRERLNDVVEDRDRWRDQAERAMRMLTDQRPLAQPGASSPPARRRRWWPFGK